MTAKRGRKEDVSDTPNRSRDVQRAFRLRKKEQQENQLNRIKRLESEVNELREQLGLGPRENTPEDASVGTPEIEKELITVKNVKSKLPVVKKAPEEDLEEIDELDEDEDEKPIILTVVTEASNRRTSWGGSIGLDARMDSVGMDGRRASMSASMSQANGSNHSNSPRPISSYPSPSYPSYPSPSLHSITSQSNHSSPRLQSIQSEIFGISSTPPSWPVVNTEGEKRECRPPPPTIEEEAAFLVDYCSIKLSDRGTNYELFAKTLMRGLEVTEKGKGRREALSFEEKRKQQGKACCGGLVDCSTDNFELNEIPPGYLTAPHAWSLLAALDQTLDGFALGTIILEAGEGPEQKGQLISSNISCNKQHGLLVVGGVVDSVGGILDLMRLKGN